MKEELKDVIKNLPQTPGVYLYSDNTDKVIYVGKAKNLRKRVSSYFLDSKNNSGKLKVLVSKIRKIEHIVVDSETDALLLENNLIKKYQPRYNILLKDDKSYPWICVKNENYPRVFQTRHLVKDGSLYYGPYTSLHMVKTLLELIKQLFPLRNCNYNLSPEKVAEGKYKLCLEYHVGNCKAPCEGMFPEEEYRKNIDQIKNILKGNLSTVTSYLKQIMQEYADRFEFENAQMIKDKIDIIQKYQAKSTVVSSSLHNLDVYSIIDDENAAYVNFMKISNGAIIQSHTVEIKKKLEEKQTHILPLAIIDIRQRLFSNAREIIVPFIPEMELENVSFHVPKRGDKLKLFELSERNAKYFRLERLKQKQNTTPKKHTDRIMETMRKDLRMKELPVHLECFDNSNIQGTNPVAACVVFRNGKPYKRDYRHFNIKTVEGPDDFASMEEVVYRRYKRLMDEGKSLPQLIVIDGGKGQLGSALNALEKLDLRGKISIIGIAKKLEEIYFPGDSVPLYLDKASETLKIIQNARNEAHRFGITFHRDKRSKSQVGSELDSIKGIGDKTKQALFKKFKTVKNIKYASFDELSVEIGKAKAKIVQNYFISSKNT